MNIKVYKRKGFWFACENHDAPNLPIEKNNCADFTPLPWCTMQSTLDKLIIRGENSPFYKLLNIKIEEVKENYARLSIKVGKKHIQFQNAVHGGVITSLADSAAAWAIYGSNNWKGTPVTVEMKMNFLRLINSGTLVAEARNIHTGSRIFVSDVDVRNEKDELIAKSLVTYYLLKSRQKGKV
ncbi:MAG: PaaI family thioesterase [Candidatus Bathyarchaeota archaeon]|nr:PaaI family thioesterase [Candidatus Bathyarchaeota archaeon]MDH5788238.1 PaaI family thioesterase [Candidatus Bathyarchaeota archaeon]